MNVQQCSSYDHDHECRSTNTILNRFHKISTLSVLHSCIHAQHCLYIPCNVVSLLLLEMEKMIISARLFMYIYIACLCVQERENVCLAQCFHFIHGEHYIYIKCVYILYIAFAFLLLFSSSCPLLLYIHYCFYKCICLKLQVLSVSLSLFLNIFYYCHVIQPVLHNMQDIYFRRRWWLVSRRAVQQSIVMACSKYHIPPNVKQVMMMYHVSSICLFL